MTFLIMKRKKNTLGKNVKPATSDAQEKLSCDKSDD